MYIYLFLILERNFSNAFLKTAFQELSKMNSKLEAFDYQGCIKKALLIKNLI